MYTYSNTPAFGGGLEHKVKTRHAQFANALFGQALNLDDETEIYTKAGVYTIVFIADLRECQDAVRRALTGIVAEKMMVERGGHALFLGNKEAFSA